MIRPFLLIFATSLFFAACSTKDPVMLESPDGSIRFMLYLDEESAMKYDLRFGDSLILEAGSLGQ